MIQLHRPSGRRYLAFFWGKICEADLILVAPVRHPIEVDQTIKRNEHRVEKGTTRWCQFSWTLETLQAKMSTKYQNERERSGPEKQTGPGTLNSHAPRLTSAYAGVSTEL